MKKTEPAGKCLGQKAEVKRIGTGGFTARQETLPSILAFWFKGPAITLQVVIFVSILAPY